MRRPGIEPGSSGWKPKIITTRPPAHNSSSYGVFLKITNLTPKEGFEPSTPSLGGKCSIQLSYLGLIKFKSVKGFKKCMIIKVLGVIDIFTGLLFWAFGILGIGNKEFILLLGLILLIKGIVFMTSMNIISLFDMLSGGVIILAVGGSGEGISKIIVIIVSLFLLQKGAFSLAS